MLAIIAMHRAGRVTTAEVPDLWELFADVPVGSTVTVDADEDDAQEDDAGPPPESKSGRPSSSGASTPNGSETSDGPPRVIGNPASATSGSGPVTSVI